MNGGKRLSAPTPIASVHLPIIIGIDDRGMIDGRVAVQELGADWRQSGPSHGFSDCHGNCQETVVAAKEDALSEVAK